MFPKELGAVLCTVEPLDQTGPPMGIEEKVFQFPLTLSEHLAHHVGVGTITEERTNRLGKGFSLEAILFIQEVGVLEFVQHVQVGIPCPVCSVWSDTSVPSHSSRAVPPCA